MDIKHNKIGVRGDRRCAQREHNAWTAVDLPVVLRTLEAPLTPGAGIQNLIIPSCRAGAEPGGWVTSLNNIQTAVEGRRIMHKMAWVTLYAARLIWRVAPRFILAAACTKARAYQERDERHDTLYTAAARSAGVSLLYCNLIPLHRQAVRGQGAISRGAALRIFATKKALHFCAPALPLHLASTTRFPRRGVAAGS